MLVFDVLVSPSIRHGSRRATAAARWASVSAVRPSRQKWANPAGSGTNGSSEGGRRGSQTLATRTRSAVTSTNEP